jgi:transposase
MSKVLSLDLRVRVLKAVADGASHRTAAVRFGVSAASVSRWRALERVQGDARPGPLGGDRRSARIEAQGALIRELLDETPDMTTEELRAALAERGQSFGYGTLQRFFRRHGLTRKKRRRTRASKTAPTSRSGGRPGSTAKSTLRPSGWCSSMKPGPRPTWPALMGDAPAAGGCAWACRMAIGKPRPSSAP